VIPEINNYGIEGENYLQSNGQQSSLSSNGGSSLIAVEVMPSSLLEFGFGKIIFQFLAEIF